MTDRQAQTKPNIDHKTVAGVGEEWEAFDQRALAEDEWRTLSDNYFSTFPFDELHRDAEGFDVARLPLSFYRHSSFYTMRTDPLDHFGTRREHRFGRTEIETMMRNCVLNDIRFREGELCWVACRRKA